VNPDEASACTGGAAAVLLQGEMQLLLRASPKVHHDSLRSGWWIDARGEPDVGLKVPPHPLRSVACGRWRKNQKWSALMFKVMFGR